VTGRSQNVSGQVCRDAVLLPLQLDKGTVSDVDIDFKQWASFPITFRLALPVDPFFAPGPRDGFRLIIGDCTEDDMYK